MKIFQHSKDWCHICGSREYSCLDFWYPKNAEHDKKDESQYIRICVDCLTVAVKDYGWIDKK